jgi:TatD DNase family protein
MIDTHVHLNGPPLLETMPAPLERARAAGVTRCVVVGFDRASSENAVTLAHTYPDVAATVGIHPAHIDEYDEAVHAQLKQWLQDPSVVALGEVGLDFYRGADRSVDQIAVFRHQLALARAVGAPVIVHCRDAYEETIALLETEAVGLIVVLHCFGGTLAQAHRAWANGWYTGIDGPVTFKNASDLREIVRAAPSDRLLLETDAPYLSPEPLRGRFPNEPSRLPHIVAAVAGIRGVTIDALAALTDENARRAFRKLV